MARVVVDVMLKPEILDPQGQAVANALPRLGVDGVASVRIGRRIELEFDGNPDPTQVNELAHRLLANPVIEDYTITIGEEAAGAHAANGTRVTAAPAATAAAPTAGAAPTADAAATAGPAATDSSTAPASPASTAVAAAAAAGGEAAAADPAPNGEEHS